MTLHLSRLDEDEFVNRTCWQAALKGGSQTYRYFRSTNREGAFTSMAFDPREETMGAPPLGCFV